MNWSRLRLPRICVVCLLVALAGVAHGQPRPNVIIMVADDAGYADFGFMNQFVGQTTEFKTPNIDALAQQSRVFSNGYVSSSVCAASRAGLLTGRYQQKFGTDYNYSSANTPLDGIPTNELLMTEALKQAGYRTGVFGKWHIGTETAKQPQSQGVDEFYGIYAGGRPYFASAGGVPVVRNTTTIAWQNEASFNNIPPDPVLGRSFTDALGDEASKFVANSANQTNPFFMYVPFTAPHAPYDLTKQQDLAQFDATSLTGLRKNVAAQTLALDRAVGNIMSRVNDPNGDGNTSDSVADNTIVVFWNDNGGEQPYAASNNEIVHNQGPLFKYKGSGWEGGTRVPATLKMPGVAPGVFNSPVMSTDLMPTILAAAGITAPANLDGKDLKPYLTGVQTGAVHDSLFWRGGVNYWAIRRGEWKLVHGSYSAGFQLYKLNPDGSGEAPGSTSYNNLEPAIYRSMLNEFVDWEATLSKPTNTTNFSFNRFDAFRYRQNDATAGNWRDGGIWADDASPATFVTMMREDSYANAALVFQPRNDASYTSNNNISRSTGLYYPHIDNGLVNPAGLIEFMLNELRFDGQFTGATNLSGTLTGYPLLFVKNLNGVNPKIRLNNSSSVASNFAFNVNMDVVLHDNLEITGDSAQPFVINGQIRDFDEAMSLTKSGLSAITLTGNNTYKGATIVNRGTLRIDGPSAVLANTSSVQIGPQGTLTLAAGRIRTNSVQIEAGGTFNFLGGILETPSITGNLAVNGGTFRPGLSPAMTTISGDFTHTAGTVVFEIGGLTAGTQYDQIIVGDDVTLSGAMQVSLVNLGGGTFSPALGSTFEILRAGDVLSGSFSSITAPALSGGRKWAIQNSGRSVLLSVVASLAADFDDNNVVNNADLALWRSNLGPSAVGDADGDGDTDGNDFLVWQRQLGSRIFASSSVASAIPEPDSALLVAVASGILCGGRKACARSGRRPTLFQRWRRDEAGGCLPNRCRSSRF